MLLLPPASPVDAIDHAVAFAAAIRRHAIISFRDFLLRLRHARMSAAPYAAATMPRGFHCCHAGCPLLPPAAIAADFGASRRWQPFSPDADFACRCRFRLRMLPLPLPFAVHITPFCECAAARRNARYAQQLPCRCLPLLAAFAAMPLMPPAVIAADTPLPIAAPTPPLILIVFAVLPPPFYFMPAHQRRFSRVCAGAFRFSPAAAISQRRFR